MPVSAVVGLLLAKSIRPVPFVFRRKGKPPSARFASFADPEKFQEFAGVVLRGDGFTIPQLAMLDRADRDAIGAALAE